MSEKRGGRVFDLADTSLSEPANSVDSGSCASGCLLTIIPFDGYPETVWSDDMELGATELCISPCGPPRHVRKPLSRDLLQSDPDFSISRQACKIRARLYREYLRYGGSDSTLNLYDRGRPRALRTLSSSSFGRQSAGLGCQRARHSQPFVLKQVDDAIARK